MYYQSKNEVKRELGGQPLFGKLPSTTPVLLYESGIGEFDSHNTGADSQKVFGLQQYRKGFAFRDAKGLQHIGFRFDDVASVNLLPKGERYTLVVKSRFSKPVQFAFNKSDRAKVIPFFKNLPVKQEDDDPRNEETIRTEILRLRNEFAEERLSNGEFLKAFHNDPAKQLDINPERVRWGKTEIPLQDITGFSLGFSILSSSGIDNYSYHINLHRPDKPYFIRFNSTSTFSKTGAFSKDMEDIHDVLFDLISRPRVAEWLEKFANNETVDYSEFTLSRHGLLLKSKKPNVMIYWDELVANEGSVFRWRYTNTVFFILAMDEDRRSNMLMHLINWLNSDPGRVVTLAGRLH